MDKCIAVAAIVMTVASGARGQDALAGSWEGNTRSGAAIVLTVAVKGTALTGMLVRDGQSTTLSEGKVSKNTFTFKAVLNGQTQAFSGEVAGDELKIWMDRQGPETAIVLRRAKSK